MQQTAAVASGQARLKRPLLTSNSSDQLNVCQAVQSWMACYAVVAAGDEELSRRRLPGALQSVRGGAPGFPPPGALEHVAALLDQGVEG